MRSNTQKIERPKKNPGYLNFCEKKSPEIFFLKKYCAQKIERPKNNPGNKKKTRNCSHVPMT